MRQRMGASTHQSRTDDATQKTDHQAQPAVKSARRIGDIHRVEADQYSYKLAGQRLLEASAEAAKTAIGVYVGVSAARLALSGIPEAPAAANGQTPFNVQNFGAIGIAGGVLPLVANGTKELLGKVYHAVYDGAKLSETRAEMINHQRYKAATAQWLKDQPDYIKDPIRTVDEAIERELGSALQREEEARLQGLPSPLDSHSLERAKRLHKWKDMYLVNRPSTKKMVEQWKTEAGREALEKRLDKKLALCAPADRDFYRQTALDFAAASVAYVNQTGPQPSISGILIGPPGTGKDFFVLEVLGEELGLPVVPLYVPIKERGGFAEMYPKPWDAIGQTKFATKDADLLGLILAGAARAEHTNIIFFWNELNARDPETIDGIKVVADPEHKLMDHAALNTKFDVSAHSHIFTFNPEDGGAREFLQSKAVRSRMNFIHETQPATVELVSHKARAEFDRKAEQFLLPIVGGDGKAVLDPAKQERLCEAFELVLPTIVEQHRAVDRGARIGYVGQLTSRIGHMLRRDEPLRVADLHAEILEHYRMEKELDDKVKQA